MISNGLHKLKSELKDKKLDGVLVSSVANIAYLTGYSNFFKEERDGFVLITKDENYILTHSIYSKELEGKISGFGVIEISRREPPEKAILKIIKNPEARLGIEETDLRVYEYKKLLRVFKNLKNVNLHINRAIKSKDEIKFIEKACVIGDKVFTKVLKKIKLGISEKRLVFEIDSLIKKLGYENSFRTIVAFGKNAAYPHHQSGNDRLENNQFVLMDFGVVYENYCSDMTRTVFWGKAKEKQKKIYKTVKEAQEKAVEFINNSKGEARASAVDKTARNYIITQGFESIPHSLGHGIGLQVHEHPYLSPKSKEILKPGMVFSIEPGIYIPEFGGVRIEDLYLMTEKGLEKLTKSPSSLIELKRGSET